MSSVLKVSEIQDPTNGNSALTINSSGNVHMPGSVVQCQVQTQTMGNSTSGADLAAVSVTSSGLSNAYAVNTVNITPKFSDSKILMQWAGQFYIDGTQGGGADIFFTKDDTNLITNGGNRNAVGFVYTASQSDTDIYGMWSSQFSFTAGQTTQMTLKCEIAPYNANKDVYFQHDGTTTLTVWEIAQ